MTRAVPPGWPEGLPPVGAAEFEEAAIAWMWDTAPFEWRQDEALRRYPLLLGRFLLERLRADVAAARAVWMTEEQWADAQLPADAWSATRQMLEREGRALKGRAQSAEVVIEGLRSGRAWIPKL